MALNILLVEDDVDLARGIIDFLALKEIDCDYASDGRMGLNFATTNQYDLMILDINLPHISGYNICRQIRNKGIDTPVLMLTAKIQLKINSQVLIVVQMTTLLSRLIFKSYWLV